MAPPATTASGIIEPADSYPHPTLPAPSAWPFALVIVCILWIVGTAALLGPIVRALMTPMRDENTEEDASLPPGPFER